jgi:hypothetical protein
MALMAGQSTIGDVGEHAVAMHIEAGSGYVLSAYKPEPDVHHGDLTIEDADDKTVTAQVKVCTHPDREGRIVCFAGYPEHAIPENPRLFYVFGLLQSGDREVRLVRVWLVPSAQFNALAYRERRSDEPGRVVLQFSCLASGDPKWDAFELAPIALGTAFQKILGDGPASWRATDIP